MSFELCSQKHKASKEKDRDKVLLYFAVGVIALIVLFLAKKYLCDKPHEKELALVKTDKAVMRDKYEQEIEELKTENEHLIKKMSLMESDCKDQIKKIESIRIQNEKVDQLQISSLKERLDSSIFISEIAKSNIRAIPYMAAIMADFETYGLEKLARKLEWGSSAERVRKVKAIREIRRDAQAMVEKNKESQYQLAYLLKLFPTLQDVIDTEYEQLPIIDVKELSDYDGVRDYLSKEEYQKLSVVERNQLALDRYVASRSKSKWQIGRDYEMYIGYSFTQKGYKVDYFGIQNGMEDLGRDLIVQKGNSIIIVQCKFWSQNKLIHENHINQLYGTMVCYCLEHQIDKTKTDVQALLVTNIKLSNMAKKMAEYLAVQYWEDMPIGDYPRIKCNIGRGEYGETTRIYHLPFDQQYDTTKIENPGECMAMTVQEAVNKGFRRAYKWFGE